ncbi:hypothetical protein [Marinovum sp.]|uniref:hypothetical protein n=1 Tax=Marinovum sp. TaxID=2024839 RepID=UPI002B26492B|nr:hypothetical protein [Marinovum sp.]
MSPPPLQDLLFEDLEQRQMVGESMPPRVFFYGDVGRIGADLWVWAAGQGAELVLRDGKAVGPRWVVDNAWAFDCMIVDAEYLEDLEDTVDFCMAVRRAVPELRILLVSTEVRESDLSSARMLACDATLKWPAGSQALAAAVRATIENHRWFLAACHGVNAPA